ncbi:MAG TPA: ABC transporter permease [Bryobacteraceae bacterium]|nr:ABC transporter permease [Bryobacteraceae bacterium]
MRDLLTLDLRFVVRSLSKTPAFSVVAILTLAVGIGANTAIFSGIHTLLLGPMPYAHPERLVAIWEDASAVGFPHNNPAVANYLDWKRMNHVFTDMAALRFRVKNLTGEGRPEAVLGRGVTSNFFDVLGSRPLLGRTFTEQEDRTGAKVVVIGYGLWQRRFGGARDVIGRTLLMDKEPYTVIGVMRAAFAYPDRRYEFWEPAHFTPKELANRNNHYLEVVARLRPGVSVKAARADMNRVAAQLSRAYPDTNTTLDAVVVPLRTELTGDTGTAFELLLIAAGVVLLIACANVANLLLIRGAERRRELAVRTALGATRGRIVRQLLIESLVLTGAGAVAGILIAFVGTAGLQALIPEELVTASPLTISTPVLCFAIAVSLISGILFGLFPAVQSSRLDVQDALKQGGRAVAGASGYVRNAFVVAQIAMALGLLTGAGLLIKTLGNLRSVDVGFPSDHLLTMATNPSPQVYNTDPKLVSFSDRVIEKVSQLPGVRSAAFASDIPFSSIGDTSSFEFEGRAHSRNDQFNDALYREISTNYLQTLGARLLSGRLIDRRDTPSSQPVLVINETFARRFWPNSSPLGTHLRIGGDGPFRTVVGVIADVRERGLQLDMKPAVYLPYTQVKRPGVFYLLVRTKTEPMAVADSVRNAIWSVDPEQPVAMIRTMDDYAALEMRDLAHEMRVFTVFSSLALFLAALGVYGVLAYAVAQRRREIGIRRALGANTANVTSLILRQGVTLAAMGLGIGALITAVSTRAMQGLLFGVKPLDPMAFSAGAVVLLTAALLACVIPSSRASRIDPAAILREE